MIASVKLGLDERLVIESGVNHYKVVGPGRIWLRAGQRSITQLYVGPRTQSFTFSQIYTAEKVPLEVSLQIRYQIAPDLFKPDLLPALVKLNEGGWKDTLQWQTQYLVQQMVADHTWQDLGRQAVQHRLEGQLSHSLAEDLKGIALSISNIYLTKLVLPVSLQRTITQAAQDEVEARGRALVLKEYLNIFGHSLPEAMPHIIQWELLTMLHKSDNPQLLLTATGLSLELSQQNPTKSSQPVLQMSLPAFQKG